jgi:hypothetical protein
MDTTVDTTERRQLFMLWMRHFGAWFVVYLLAYAGAMWALLRLPPGTMRSTLVLAPILPGLGLIWSTVLAYRRADEFVQREILLAGSLAALFTAVWTLAYAFLEPLGLPHLNMGFVHTFGWPVFIWRMVQLMRLRG